MLNILEGYDVGKLGFGTVDTIHLLAEVLKIAFADRAEASGDPAFVKVPVERITSKAYADQRRAGIDLAKAQALDGRPAGRGKAPTPRISPSPTARATSSPPPRPSTACSVHAFIVPGTGMIPNDYMSNFDPRPGNALSIEPGKRVTTSMSPMMALRDGKVVYALGLPGGRKIFPAAMQALINLIDHGMTPAGGGRGAARLDRGPVPRGRARHPGEHPTGPGSARPQAGAHADRVGRHERHPVPRRRHA